MSSSNRIILSLFGTLWTAMILIIGCFADRIVTFTCVRDQTNQQGVCKLEQSTTFLPWNKKVVNFQLNNIQKAKSIELGIDNYSVVLLGSNKSSVSLHHSMYSQNSEVLAKEINSFLGNSKAKKFHFREGNGIEGTIVLLIAGIFGLLCVWIGIKPAVLNIGKIFKKRSKYLC